MGSPSPYRAPPPAEQPGRSAPQRVKAPSGHCWFQAGDPNPGLAAGRGGVARAGVVWGTPPTSLRAQTKPAAAAPALHLYVNPPAAGMLAGSHMAPPASVPPRQDGDPRVPRSPAPRPPQPRHLPPVTHSPGTSAAAGAANGRVGAAAGAGGPGCSSAGGGQSPSPLRRAALRSFAEPRTPKPAPPSPPWGPCNSTPGMGGGGLEPRGCSAPLGCRGLAVTPVPTGAARKRIWPGRGKGSSVRASCLRPLPDPCLRRRWAGHRGGFLPRNKIWEGGGGTAGRAAPTPGRVGEPGGTHTSSSTAGSSCVGESSPTPAGTRGRGSTGGGGLGPTGDGAVPCPGTAQHSSHQHWGGGCSRRYPRWAPGGALTQPHSVARGGTDPGSTHPGQDGSHHPEWAPHWSGPWLSPRGVGWGALAHRPPPGEGPQSEGRGGGEGSPNLKQARAQRPAGIDSERGREQSGARLPRAPQESPSLNPPHPISPAPPPPPQPLSQAPFPHAGPPSALPGAPPPTAHPQPGGCRGATAAPTTHPHPRPRRRPSPGRSRRPPAPGTGWPPAWGGAARPPAASGCPSSCSRAEGRSARGGPRGAPRPFPGGDRG